MRVVARQTIVDTACDAGKRIAVGLDLDTLTVNDVLNNPAIPDKQAVYWLARYRLLDTDTLQRLCEWIESREDVDPGFRDAKPPAVMAVRYLIALHGDPGKASSVRGWLRGDRCDC